MVDEEQPVDATVVAKYLGIAVYTVYQHAKTGKIPAFKVGNQWRFFLSDIRAHLSKPRDPWAQSAVSRGRKRAS